MRTKDVLKEALIAFDGTIILVSHDRDFLDGLVDRVYEFRGGQVREYIGGIHSFLQSLESEETGSDISVSQSRSAKVSSGAEMPSDGRVGYERQKEQAKLLRQAERNVLQCETHIAEIEDELAALETQLSTPEGAADAQLAVRYAEKKNELERAMSIWEQAGHTLEALTQDK